MKKRILILVGLLAIAVGAGALINRVIDRTAPNGDPAEAFAELPIPPNANIFVELAKRVVPSVVNISTTAKPRRSGNDDEMFRRFFEYFFRGQPGGPQGSPHGGQMPPPRSRPMSLGSGFIIDGSGLIMTNNHVVEGADEIKIHFTENPEEKFTDGELVGRDVELDIALIQVKTDRKLVPLPLGDSEKLQVGEYVMAVGNPIGHGHSVSHGIISAKGRDAPNFPLARYLQTDAPINPGNSGGPLVNLKGQVIGINNAIDARAQGIGFAIPINAVKRVLEQLKSKGSVARGYIGVLVAKLTKDIKEKIGVPQNIEGPFVSHVYPDEPADKAGVEPYDVILEVNGKKIRDGKDLIREVTRVAVGDTVPVKVYRDGKEKNLKIKVAERPVSPQLAKVNPKLPKKKKEKAPVETGMSLETLNARLASDLGLPKGLKGVVVTSLEYNGAAARSGLYRGDVILEVNKKKVSSVEQFYRIVKSKKGYLLRIRRPAPKGQEVFSVVVLDLSETKE